MDADIGEASVRYASRGARYRPIQKVGARGAGAGARVELTGRKVHVGWMQWWAFGVVARKLLVVICMETRATPGVVRLVVLDG